MHILSKGRSVSIECETGIHTDKQLEVPVLRSSYTRTKAIHRPYGTPQCRNLWPNQLVCSCTEYSKVISTPATTLWGAFTLLGSFGKPSKSPRDLPTMLNTSYSPIKRAQRRGEREYWMFEPQSG
ncbi:hypothetical protein F5Y03DRAFT_356039 [Xylaria venustula]|nr:hypothetical protein F5Y03DRAFT_356039 [Xylaria venustula]